MRSNRSLPIFLSAIILLTTVPAVAQVAKVEPLNIDLGTMNQRELRLTSVNISNAGGGILEIREVKADCNCTVGELKKDKLAPGESTTLDIEFTSKLFNGPQVKMIHLYTNDPDRPVIDVVLKVNVTAPVLVDPLRRRIAFPMSLQEDVLTRDVIFTATTIPVLEINATQSKRGFFPVEIMNGYEGNPQKSLMRITRPANIPLGRINDPVVVRTNIPEESSINIDVIADTGNKIITFPTAVKMRFVKRFKKEVRVSPFPGTRLDYKITKLEIDVPGVTAEFARKNKNNEVVINLRGEPILKTDPRAIEAHGKISGFLYIHTDQEDIPVLKVPINYMVRM